MSNEMNQMWTELTAEESASIQGGWSFNIPFYSPAVGFAGGGIDKETPALGSYGSKTTSQNYGFFSAWNDDGRGNDGTSNGFSAYIPGVTGWWEPGGTDPQARNAGAMQVMW